MKLVVVSDTHAKHERLGTLSGDVLIHCGDMCDGFRRNPLDLQRIDAWFGRQDFDLILCVGGNHDFFLQDRTDEPSPVFQNATYLEDSSHIYQGVLFHGVPWVPNLPGWAFYLADDELRDKWAAIPEGTDVLITHTAPWHILDYTRGRTHCGCSHLRRRVEAIQPRLHCFGHNHAARGRVDRNGTTFLNASMLFGVGGVPETAMEFEL